MALTHRRTKNTIANDGNVVLFCDSNNNRHYGNHCWTLESDLPSISDCEDVIEAAMDFYGIDQDVALAELNPSDIVDSAGAWDDSQFVSDLWHVYGIERPGYLTADGAVVLDRYSVELTYSQDVEV